MKLQRGTFHVPANVNTNGLSTLAQRTLNRRVHMRRISANQFINPCLLFCAQKKTREQNQLISLARTMPTFQKAYELFMKQHILMVYYRMATNNKQFRAVSPPPPKLTQITTSSHSEVTANTLVIYDILKTAPITASNVPECE